MVDIDTNKHSVYSLKYHLVLIVKYRKKVIDQEKCEFLESVFRRIGEKNGVSVIEWDCGNDHVHVLFKAKPSTCLSKFINAYKSASSRLIKKNFLELKKDLWKGYFWSRSYFLSSVGGATLDTVKRYIENHGLRRTNRSS